MHARYSATDFPEEIRGRRNEGGKGKEGRQERGREGRKEGGKAGKKEGRKGLLLSLGITDRVFSTQQNRSNSGSIYSTAAKNNNDNNNNNDKYNNNNNNYPLPRNASASHFGKIPSYGTFFHIIREIAPAFAVACLQPAMANTALELP